MSKPQRDTKEFKLAAVKQVTERHYPVAEVAERLGVSSHSLYAWIRRYSQPDVQQQHDSSQQAEIRRLKAEPRRVTDERDILKRPPRTLPSCQGKVHLHPGARVRTSHPPTVLDDECPPERLLRLAAPACIYPRSGRPTPPRPDQAKLARKPRRLWLSQDPGRPARDGRDLRETPGGAINAS